jgi:hypothetical protein
MKSFFFKSIAILFATVMLASCGSPASAPNNPGDPNGDINSLADVNVPQNFDWRTYSNFEFSINASQAGVLQITSPNQDVVYYAAFLSGSEAHSFNLPLPTFEKKVRAVFNGQSAQLDVTRTRITHNFN